MERKTFLVLLVILLSTFAQVEYLFAQNKILLVPLDDRPSSWQFPQRMALIDDSEIVIPPRSLLGHFRTPGRSDQIVEWIKSQDLLTYSAAIISMDMISYGGLVPSREHHVGIGESSDRIKILETLRTAAPHLRIYVQSVIMRLALTYSEENAAYHGKFTEWAKTVASSDKISRQRAVKLEREIPTETIQKYQLTRKRNIANNLLAVDLVEKGVIDFLILSQDDASPIGIHISDREKLQAKVNQLGLSDRVIIQPGADEVAMLLLSRLLSEKQGRAIRVKPIYCAESKSNTVMPYEDLPLRNTVSHHIASVGALETQHENSADLLFFVFSSRDKEGAAESFASELEKRVKQGKRVVVADVDPTGIVQGGDEEFSNLLINRKLFSKLSGYASWNTAGNTIGTALPQGIVYTLAENKLTDDPCIQQRILSAQSWFTLHRVMDDFYYHNLVRKQTYEFVKQNEITHATMSNDEVNRSIENYSAKLMRDAFEEFVPTYFGVEKVGRLQSKCRSIGNLYFRLPWNRTFEAEIDFEIQCRVPPFDIGGKLEKKQTKNTQ